MKINNKDPLWIKRMSQFAKTALQHKLSGLDYLNSEQIEERLKICLGCPKFRLLKQNGPEIAGVCGKEEGGCGCKLGSKQTNKFMNKLAYPLEKCPVDKWGPIIEIKKDEPGNSDSPQENKE